MFCHKLKKTYLSYIFRFSSFLWSRLLWSWTNGCDDDDDDDVDSDGDVLVVIVVVAAVVIAELAVVIAVGIAVGVVVVVAAATNLLPSLRATKRTEYQEMRTFSFLGY